MQFRFRNSLCIVKYGLWSGKKASSGKTIVVIQTVKTVYADHRPIKGPSKLSAPILLYKVSV